LKIRKVIIIGLGLITVLFMFNKYSTKDTFRTLTKDELNKYLVERNISPIEVKNIEPHTMVLSEGWFLSLSVYKDSGRISSIGSPLGNSSTEPVRVSLASWGNQDNRNTVATVIINNMEILEKAHKVRVRINSRNGLFEQIELLNNKNGSIVYFNETHIIDSRLEGIILYDKDGTEIYNTLF
jgi:hypothetical protein